MRPDGSQQDLFVKAPIWYEGLKNKQKLFVEYYCTDKTCFLNATAAYIKAYGNGGKELSEKSIQSNASRLSKEPAIKLAIAKLLRASQNEEDQISEYKLLDYLKTLAFYNPKDIIDRFGTIKVNDIEELGDLAICIQSIKKTKSGYEVKLYDRTKALELFGRYLNVIRPEEGATVFNPVVYIAGKDVEGLNEQAHGTKNADDAEFEVINGEPENAEADAGGLNE